MQLCFRSVFNGSQAWGLNPWFRVQGRDLPIVWKKETGKNVQVCKYFFCFDVKLSVIIVFGRNQGIWITFFGSFIDWQGDAAAH